MITTKRFGGLKKIRANRSISDGKKSNIYDSKTSDRI
nr:MAG TPA: hypothetical protein [Caudoviricetes sp.]